jgi:PAS domain S-box-containing protein
LPSTVIAMADTDKDPAMEQALGRGVDALPGLVGSALPDGQIGFLNQRWCEYTGRGVDECRGRGWQTAVHPQDLPRLLAGWRDIPASSAPVEAEARVRGPDGKYRWYLFLSHPLIDASGQVVKWCGFSIDIDDRKRAEDALRDSTARFRDYAETASDWLWETGPDYEFTLLTGNAFGSDGANRIGTKCWDHALDLESEPEKWRLVIATLDSRKPFRDFVYCSVDGNGAPLFVKASGKPVFDANGEFRGYRGTGTDVTAIMRAERAEASLRTVEADLAHISRVTTVGQLAASIAHEINQPIAAALIGAEAALRWLARQPPDAGEAIEAINRIKSDVMRTADIVARTRALVRKAPARKDELQINQAISEVIGLARSEVLKNGVHLQTRLAEDLPVIQGDRVQLQQVMLNLIMNAVEAMSPMRDDRRELLVSTRSEADCVLVAIRDSGPGLSEVAIERAFEPFYTTKSSGLGMGLSICRSIVEAHGGRLWATANVPKGAAFQFTVPIPSDRQG